MPVGDRPNNNTWALAPVDYFMIVNTRCYVVSPRSPQRVRLQSHPRLLGGKFKAL
jgi:hypothetical protein